MEHSKIQIQIYYKPMGHQHSKSPLSIRISTSQNQSDQLFDFHKSPVREDQKVLKDTSFLVGFGETVKLVDNHFLQTEVQMTPSFALFKISQDPYQQLTITGLGDDYGRVLWRVVKHGDAYPLKIGQCLKIGKIQMELKRIICDKTEKEIESIGSKEELTGQEIQVRSARSQKSASNPNCRICFQPQVARKDPLVCLCKCTGSIQYTHFQCLKDWITSGFQKRQEKGFKYCSHGEITCQVCKQKLPLNFKYEKKDYSFYEMDIDAPYAEFESVTSEHGKPKFSRYLIDLGKHHEIMIGRSNTCQVTMKDISISRVHCSLEFKHGMLLVRDKKSKFGTLIKMKDSVDFTSQNGIQLQFGPHLIELHKKHLLKCCCFNFDNYKLVYEEENKPRTSYERYQRTTQAQSLLQTANTNQNEEEQNSVINASMLRTRFVRDQNI